MRDAYNKMKEWVSKTGAATGAAGAAGAASGARAGAGAGALLLGTLW